MPKLTSFQSLSKVIDSTLNDTAEVTAFAPKDVVDDIQGQLDTLVIALENVVCVLKRRRNAVALVSRIPSEILCSIFEYVRDTEYVGDADSDSEDSSTDREDPSIYDWIRCTTHVCAEWRQIAIGYPALWCHIDYEYGPMCVQEMLRRSDPIPVFVTANINVDVVDPDMFPPIPSYFAHVKDFQIGTQEKRKKKWGLMNQLYDLPTTSAPLLERLRITVELKYGDPYPLPDDMFAGGMPGLRYLELLNCDLDWESPVMMSPLTTLKVSFSSSSHASSGPSVESVISFLKNMPSLEILEIRNILDPDKPRPPPTSRTVDLTRLTSLFIEASTHLGAHILDHLVLTPRTSIRFESSRIHSQDIQKLIPSLRYWSSIYRQAGLDPIAMLDYTVHQDSSIIGLELQTAGFAQEPPLRLLLRTHQHDLEVHVHVAALLAALPTVNLQTLQVRRYPDRGASSWLQFFGPLDTLETIRVFETQGGLFEALASDVHATQQYLTRNRRESQKKAASLLFPVLSTVHINGVLFQTGGSLGMSVSSFNQLWEALTMRMKYGQRVSRLELESCFSIASPQVLELKKTVDELIWDRRERRGYPSYY